MEGSCIFDEYQENSLIQGLTLIFPLPAVLDHVLVQLFVELRNRLFEETLFDDLSDFL